MKIFDDILDNYNASKFESEYFARRKISEIKVIEFIGEEIAKSFLAEFGRFSLREKITTVLASIGTGHNAADALAFLYSLSLERKLNVSLLCSDISKLKANTKTMLERLKTSCELEILSDETSIKDSYTLVVEGISAMSYHPPMRPETARRIRLLNNTNADVKIAIDIPIGLSDDDENCPVFSADITYATAIAKETLFRIKNKKFSGRIRYIVAYFFENQTTQSQKLIVKPNALTPLSMLRNSLTDKRTFGKLLIISGSERYAGAALLNAKTAVRAGVGFVYACIGESFKPSFCANEPSVIWHACQYDEIGALALENFTQINALAKNADAIVVGSGLTDSREALALVGEVLKANETLPAVIDADAITRSIIDVVSKRATPAILTPHEGEFLRIADNTSDKALLECAKSLNCTIMLKSNITRICDGECIAFSTRGSPALARAGSGDILCALTASILANKTILDVIKAPSDNQKKICQKVCAMSAQWLGIAAERASAESGEFALSAMEIINYLPKALL